MGSIQAGAILLLTRLHKKAAPASAGYLIQSTHVSKEPVPNRTHKEASMQRERKKAHNQNRAVGEGPNACLLDDHTLLTQGECKSHSQQLKKEISTQYGLHMWHRSRGFLWKVPIHLAPSSFALAPSHRIGIYHAHACTSSWL